MDKLYISGMSGFIIKWAQKKSVSKYQHFQQSTAIFTDNVNYNRRKLQKLLASLDDNSDMFLNE